MSKKKLSNDKTFNKPGFIRIKLIKYIAGYDFSSKINMKIRNFKESSTISSELDPFCQIKIKQLIKDEDTLITLGSRGLLTSYESKIY